MSVAKIAITMEEALVEQVDRLVRERAYPNRSRAIQDAVADKLRRMDRGRLARECAKLDPKLLAFNWWIGFLTRPTNPGPRLAAGRFRFESKP